MDGHNKLGWRVVVAAIAAVAGLVLSAGPATAAPETTLLGAGELPAHFSGYRSVTRPADIAIVTSPGMSERCLLATADAAAVTRTMTSHEAYASQGRSTLMVAVLSKTTAPQLGRLLEQCDPDDPAQRFQVIGTPGDLARFAPRLYWNRAADERVAYVNVRSSTVVVRTVGAPDAFWETLRKQVAKTDR